MHVKYNQAVIAHQEEILAPGDVLSKCKQMTQLTIAEAFASCTPYDRNSKQWVEVTNAFYFV